MLTSLPVALSPRSVVLDYDGTLTDVFAGAAAFRARFDRGIAGIVDRPDEEVALIFRQVEAAIDDAPDRYGWLFRGAIVAPASADPYIRATCAAHLVFDHFGILIGAGDEVLRAERIYRVHRESYQGARTVFREDARAVLEGLLARLPLLHVVTNAAPEVVSARIATLGVAGGERLRVVGDARKFVVEPASLEPEALSRIPETLMVPGLPRPILLRRGHYFDVLVAVASEMGARPEETLVCGDIFELDLALPYAMGAQVHLLTRAQTPDYERTLLAGSPRATTSEQLMGLLARFEA